MKSTLPTNLILLPSYCVHFYIGSHCIENKRDSVILAIANGLRFPPPPFFRFFYLSCSFRGDKEE